MSKKRVYVEGLYNTFLLSDNEMQQVSSWTHRIEPSGDAASKESIRAMFAAFANGAARGYVPTHSNSGKRRPVREAMFNNSGDLEIGCQEFGRLATAKLRDWAKGWEG